MEKRSLRWSSVKSQSWSEINLMGHQVYMEKRDLSDVITIFRFCFSICIKQLLKWHDALASYSWFLSVNCFAVWLKSSAPPCGLYGFGRQWRHFTKSLGGSTLFPFLSPSFPSFFPSSLFLLPSPFPLPSFPFSCPPFPLEVGPLKSS